jgi:hypothetical protein
VNGVVQEAAVVEHAHGGEAHVHVATNSGDLGAHAGEPLVELASNLVKFSAHLVEFGTNLAEP